MGYPEYIDRSNIITICGSMTLYPIMLGVARQLTLGGMIVLMPFVAMKDGDERAPALHRLHLDKIDLSGSIMVVTESGYIGKTTAEEIEYANRKGKLVRYSHLEG